ncbi:unnamed protein product [Linum tenue]|uniref:Uncharacterized protein n=1 Tax=Linum tenue TaxID=586396 RepID=A0AAV0Q6B8_9ROSI|nr:unnamed protein product [Linum tenue]
MEAAKVIAKDLGFFLTHSSTKSNDGEKYPRIYLHCHRGYKNNTYVPDPDKVRIFVYYNLTFVYNFNYNKIPITI